jgi:hypothetical protein
VQRRSQSRWNPPATGAGAATAVEDADEFEVGSLYKAGSKKQSLNHLLNFQFAPRAGSENHHPNGGRGGSGAARFSKNRFRGGGGGATQHAGRSTYRKEHYLQANCQFVVRAGGDYREMLPIFPYFLPRLASKCEIWGISAQFLSLVFPSSYAYILCSFYIVPNF